MKKNSKSKFSARFGQFLIGAEWKKEKKSVRQKMPIFEPIFDFRAERKRSRAEKSQAQNPSAQAMARASSARTYHY